MNDMWVIWAGVFTMGWIIVFGITFLVFFDLVKRNRSLQDVKASLFGCRFVGVSIAFVNLEAIASTEYDLVGHGRGLQTGPFFWVVIAVFLLGYFAFFWLIDYYFPRKVNSMHVITRNIEVKNPAPEEGGEKGE